MKTRSKNHDVNSACKQSDVGVQTYTTNDTKAGEHKEHVDKLQTDLSIAVSRNQSLEALVNELNNACKDLSSRNRVLGDKLDMQGKDVTRLNNKLRVHKKEIETCKISQTNLTEDIRVICAKCQESEIQKTELSKELLATKNVLEQKNIEICDAWKHYAELDKGLRQVMQQNAFLLASTNSELRMRE